MSNFNIQVGLGPLIPPSDAHEHHLWGVERVKRFVSVHLHHRQQLKNMSKMSMFPPWKNFCGRP